MMLEEASERLLTASAVIATEPLSRPTSIFPAKSSTLQPMPTILAALPYALRTRSFFTSSPMRRSIHAVSICISFFPCAPGLLGAANPFAYKKSCPRTQPGHRHLYFNSRFFGGFLLFQGVYGLFFSSVSSAKRAMIVLLSRKECAGSMTAGAAGFAPFPHTTLCRPSVFSMSSITPRVTAIRIVASAAIVGSK